MAWLESERLFRAVHLQGQPEHDATSARPRLRRLRLINAHPFGTIRIIAEHGTRKPVQQRGLPAPCLPPGERRLPPRGTGRDGAGRDASRPASPSDPTSLASRLTTATVKPGQGAVVTLVRRARGYPGAWCRS